MVQFRAYLLSPAGRIMQALVIEAATSREALRQALASGHPHGVEIWQGANLLHRVRGASDPLAD